MNKRIEELAEQAWDSTAVSPEFGHPVSFADKFAELIIKECLDIMKDGDLDFAIWKIKKDFGLEE